MKVQEMAEMVKGMLTRSQMLHGFVENGLLTEEVLNMIPRVAAQRAAKHQLPFPAHRLRNRQPWKVKLQDVALAIYNARLQAHKDWQSAQAR